ncbi:hypothetical protein WMY93_006531 [Mugilogobius chulae]|uniref:GP-PDE domain-containing protein n=1 Tax=Mugilogobius chulae TaxID=88201 RepID=A0AAW0PNZ5_9GOBI
MLQLGDEVTLYSVIFVVVLLGTRSAVWTSALTVSVYVFVAVFRFPQVPAVRAKQGIIAHGQSNGATGVELDLEFSADGIPILMHDETVDRTTNGSGPLTKSSFSELRKLDAAANTDSDEAERSCCSHCSYASTLELESLWGWGPTLLVSMETLLDDTVDVALDWAHHHVLWKFCGVSAFLIQKNYVSPEYVQYWAHRGVELVAWTVNTKIEKDYYQEFLHVNYITDSLGRLENSLKPLFLRDELELGTRLYAVCLRGACVNTFFYIVVVHMMYTITRGPSKLVTQRRTGPTQQIESKFSDLKLKPTSWLTSNSPPPKIVFHRLNGKRYNGAALHKPDSPVESFTPAHEENVKFVFEAWQEVEQKLENGTDMTDVTDSKGPVQYAEKTPSAAMKNFVPIDLEEWWAQRFLANIVNLS